jgi:hypothetical protein
MYKTYNLIIPYLYTCSVFLSSPFYKNLIPFFNFKVQLHKVKLPFGVFFSKRLVEPIGLLRAVIPHLSSLFPQNLEMWILLPKNSGITKKKGVTIVTPSFLLYLLVLHLLFSLRCSLLHHFQKMFYALVMYHVHING